MNIVGFFQLIFLHLQILQHGFTHRSTNMMDYMDWFLNISQACFPGQSTFLVMAYNFSYVLLNSLHFHFENVCICIDLRIFIDHYLCDVVRIILDLTLLRFYHVISSHLFTFRLPIYVWGIISSEFLKITEAGSQFLFNLLANICFYLACWSHLC